MLDFLKVRPMLLSALVTTVISVFALRSEVALFVLAIIILAVIIFLIYKRTRGELIFAALLVLAVTVSGYFTVGKANVFEEYNKVAVKGEFVVVEEPRNHGDYYYTVLEAVNCDALNKGEKIRITYSDENLKYAEKITAQILLSGIDGKEYKDNNYSQGIFLSGYIKSCSHMGESDSVLSAVGSLRKYIKKTIFKSYKADEAATIMALVAGDKTYFTDEFYGNVKGAGVAHVMVVSGMHLSTIVLMFLFLINKFFYNRYLKALTIVFVTISVMAVCGFTMSILRAGITYILMAVALMLNRENTSENTLGFTVCLIYFVNPFALFNVAFQLSVLSTFAILVVSVPIIIFIKEKEIIKKKWLLGILSSMIISISTLIFTAPVTIYRFGYISCVSLVTNLLISTPASYAMIFCILGFIFAPLLYVSEVIVTFINAVINYFGSLSFATVSTPKYTIILPIFLIVVILLVLVACKVRSDVVKLEKIKTKLIVEGGNGEYAADFGTDFKKRNKKRRKKYIHIIRK